MNLAESYSKVATKYASEIFEELEHKPFDRELLDSFARQAGEGATVCDLGCGPGQIARYLKSRGLNPVGLDISPGMIEEARRRNPGLDFRVGDMLSLPLPSGSLDGVAAFYSLIHVGEKMLPTALAEIKRTLRPGGTFLFSFHVGDETIHLDEWWGQSVNLDFHLFLSAKMKPLVQEAGFEILHIEEREPYAENVEHQSRRAYFLARNPSPGEGLNQRTNSRDPG